MRIELVIEAKEALAVLATADVAGCDRAALDGVLGHLARVRGVVDGFDVEIARRSRALAAAGRSECAEGVLGQHGRRATREAKAVAARERACRELPTFEHAFAWGAISAGHVDGLAAATRDLDDEARVDFAGHAADLLDHATALPVEEFTRSCRELARSLAPDDGTSRLERQRQQRRLRRWVDRTTGMHHLHAELDPVAGTRLDAALDAATRAARSAAARGDDVSWDHAAADALVDLVTGAQRVDRRVPDVAVHVDLRTLLDGFHSHSLCETSDGTELPPSTVRRLCCDAEIFPVVLGADGTVLDAGRSQRLANREQRRPCVRYTAPAATPAAPSRSTAARSITSSPGNGRARPTSPTSCRCAAFTTTSSTRAAGHCTWPPTASSRSSAPTARSRSTVPPSTGQRPEPA